MPVTLPCSESVPRRSPTTFFRPPARMLHLAGGERAQHGRHRLSEVSPHAGSSSPRRTALTGHTARASSWACDATAHCWSLESPFFSPRGWRGRCCTPRARSCPQCRQRRATRRRRPAERAGGSAFTRRAASITRCPIITPLKATSMRTSIPRRFANNEGGLSSEPLWVTVAAAALALRTALAALVENHRHRRWSAALSLHLAAVLRSPPEL